MGAELQYGMKLKCAHCAYSWNYQGASKWWASCPRCLWKVKVASNNNNNSKTRTRRTGSKNNSHRLVDTEAEWRQVD